MPEQTLRTGKALFYGLTLKAGSNTATVTVYDDTDALTAGNIVTKLSATIGKTISDNHEPVRMLNGVHVVTTGSGVTVSVKQIPISDSN